MRRLVPVVIAAILLTGLVVAQAEPVKRQIPFSRNTALPVPNAYTFRFSLIDAEDVASATVLWSEQKTLNLTSTTVKHNLGSVDPVGNPLDPFLFDRQLWVKLELRKRDGTWRKVGKPTRLTVVPYALSSSSLPQASITSVEILDGSVAGSDLAGGAVTADKLANGAALAEILDNDGSGSGLDADQLDGRHAAAFAGADHLHSGGMIPSPAGNLTDYAVNAVATAWDVGKFSSTAIGIDGFPVISFYDATNGTLAVRMCGNPGCSTSAVYQVDGSTDDVGQYSSVALGVGGRPCFSYHNYTTKALWFARCDTPACISSTKRVLVAGTAYGWTGLDTSITIGIDGRPVISYTEHAGVTSAPTSHINQVVVAHCGDADCLGGNTLTAVNILGAVLIGGGSFGGTSVTIGVDGLPIVAYERIANTLSGDSSSLVVTHCGDIDCSVPANNVTTVVDSGNVGAGPSMAIGGDGLPVISYYDRVNGSLMVAHCNDAACTSSTRVAAGEQGCGEFNSIDIGTDGFPMIAYSYEATNYRSLHLLDCFNYTCSHNPPPAQTPNHHSIVDLAPLAYLGSYNSVSMGSDGLPFISYYDETNGDLKWAHGILIPVGR